jgi:hypothetical protein
MLFVSAMRLQELKSQCQKTVLGSSLCEDFGFMGNNNNFNNYLIQRYVSVVQTYGKL